MCLRIIGFYGVNGEDKCGSGSEGGNRHCKENAPFHFI